MYSETQNVTVSRSILVICRKSLPSFKQTPLFKIQNKLYVLYDPHLYFQVPFATILERHSHSGLKFMALHTEENVIHKHSPQPKLSYKATDPIL